MSDSSCTHPEWTPAVKLLHLIGEFAGRGVKGMIVRRCATCNAFRLDVHVSDNKTHRIPLSMERGEAILEANRSFWTALRSWAKS